MEVDSAGLEVSSLLATPDSCLVKRITGNISGATGGFLLLIDAVNNNLIAGTKGKLQRAYTVAGAAPFNFPLIEDQFAGCIVAFSSSNTAYSSSGAPTGSLEIEFDQLQYREIANSALIGWVTAYNNAAIQPASTATKKVYKIRVFSPSVACYVQIFTAAPSLGSVPYWFSQVQVAVTTGDATFDFGPQGLFNQFDTGLQQFWVGLSSTEATYTEFTGTATVCTLTN